MIRTQTVADVAGGRLAELEAIIDRGTVAIIEAGVALRHIRDEKLYQVTHETFDTYCEERWGKKRSRIYQWIDHADVAAAIGEAAGGMSTVVDINERATRDIKAALPAVVASVKSKVAQGEDPKKAVEDAVSETRAKVLEDKAAEKAKNEEAQAKAQENLPDHLKQNIANKQAFKDKAKATSPAEPEVPLDIRVAELTEENEALKRDIAALQERIKTFEEMEALYKQGGFEEVIANKDDQIKILEGNLARESADKASYLREKDRWMKRAKDLGYSRDEIIDLKAVS